MLKGSLDAIHNGQCYGWALDDCSSVPVEVSIFVDERFAGAGKAENYRLDLEQAGLADGKLGYCIDLPDALRDGRHHRVEARDAAGRVIASRDSIQVVPRLTPAEFDRHAPWIDAPNETFEIELKKRKVAGGSGSHIRSATSAFSRAWFPYSRASCASSTDRQGLG